MSSSDALFGVIGDLKRRLRAPASPEVVHARDALCSTHADIDTIRFCDVPSRPSEDAPLRTLIVYLVRRWWRRMWR